MISRKDMKEMVTVKEDDSQPHEIVWSGRITLDCSVKSCRYSMKKYPLPEDRIQEEIVREIWNHLYGDVDSVLHRAVATLRMGDVSDTINLLHQLRHDLNPDDHPLIREPIRPREYY